MRVFPGWPVLTGIKNSSNTTSQQSAAPRMLYARNEAARQLSISVRALDSIIARHEIETRRIGRRLLVPHAELVRFSRGNHPEQLR